MITDSTLALDTEAEGLAFARDVLRIEADALDRVRERLDGTIARAAVAGPPLLGRGDRHRDGQGGAGRAEDGRDPGLDRDPGLSAPPRRGDPRRPRADPGRRRGDRPLAERRDRRGPPDRPGDPPARGELDRDHRARHQFARAGGRPVRRARADRGGVPARAGPVGEQHGADGRGRRAGAAGQPAAELPRRGLRPLPPRRQPRAAARLRRRPDADRPPAPQGPPSKTRSARSSSRWPARGGARGRS